MPDRIVSHALEQVEESHDVAVDVGIGVFDRIAYAGLCRQIDDGIEFFSSEQVLQGLSVFEVQAPYCTEISLTSGRFVIQ